MSLRCAAYARYSSDLQSPLSIDDQLRICREYAKSRGFVFLEEHVYVDEAVSGVGADHPGLGRLLNAALSTARPFDVILLDDSSRLARNTKDALTFFERLNFAGIRLIAVLKRETVEYALDEFDSHLKSAFSKLTNQMAHMRERKQKLEGERRRLTATAPQRASRRAIS